MILFLATFFLLYGGLHYYLFNKIIRAFPLGLAPRITLIALFLLLLAAPIAVRVAERSGFELSACVLSYAGYLWMGFIFLFFSVSLPLDLYRLLLSAGQALLKRPWSHLHLPPLYALFLPVLISLCVNAYGYYEALHVRVERLTIPTPKIPETPGKVRIVQISDVHIGMIIGETRLRRIIGEIRDLSPDILVSTGDLLDGQIDSLSGSMLLLKSLKPRWGKFAITGNHEFYAGIKPATAFIEDAGFTLLRGKGMAVAGVVNVAGMDDPVGITEGLSVAVSEKSVLAELPDRYFTLLLKHRPLINPESLGHFDLQLSGHTHKGQIFPFSLLTRMAFHYHAGLFTLPYHGRLYVSRGTGTWGPPIRFLAPPEITVIDLVHGSPGFLGLKSR